MGLDWHLSQPHTGRSPGAAIGYLEYPRGSVADGRGGVPLIGLPRRDQFYATRLRQLAHLDLDETRAAALWRSVARHRKALMADLGRDVGQRVALLDYIVNVEPQLTEPQIIDRPALEAMEQQAVTDSVTGLHNRAHFEMVLDWETERSMRYGRPSALVLLDLDEFKAVNDRHGHRVGDQVLQAVGTLILRHVRAADVPCRYGGDEFAIVLPDTPRTVAASVAQRICADITAWFAKNPVGGVMLDVKASCGIAFLPLATDRSGNLFEHADRALYLAKGKGGGLVVIVDDKEDVATK